MPESDPTVPRILLWEPGDPRVRATIQHASGSFVPVVFCDDDASVESLGRAAVLAAHRQARPHQRGPETDPEYAAAAVDLGLVDGAIGGATCDSGDVLRAGLHFIGSDSTVCMSMLAMPPTGSAGLRPLLLADCAVIPRPTVRQLADITLAAADAWAEIMGTQPRVALLWSSTLRPGQGHESAPYAEVLALLATRAPGLAVDGGLQVDAAINRAVAAAKAPTSAVAGQANVLIFPDLVSANTSYKLLQHAAGYEISSITHGFRRPFFDISRGCSTAEFRRSAEHCAAAVRATTALSLPPA